MTFPFCSTCHRHIRWRRSAARAALILGIGSSFVIFASGVLGKEAEKAVVGAGMIAAVAIYVSMRIYANRLRGPSCVGAGFPVRHLGWNHSVTSFAFDSRVFAYKFAKANENKLINMSVELQRLLESPAPRQVRETKRKPKRPADVQTSKPPTSDDVVAGWIQRIEEFRGAEARRAALTTALTEITERDAQRRLLGAASRIEVSSTLDKVDGLKSAAAKKRHLDDAIQLLREVMPLDMVDEAIRPLVERVAEL